MEKILIIKPSSLGDILHALQVVETLRRSRGQGSGVEITWVVRDIFAPLLEVCASVDRLLIYERKKGLRGIWELGRQLRRENFDLVLDMQGLARSAFWALCANAPRKIGRGDGREFSRFAFRELASPPPNGFKNSHAVEILAQFLPVLGLPAELRGSVTFPRAELSPQIACALAGKNPPILLFPDSRRVEKEWKFFPELTRLILAKVAQTPVAWVGQSNLRAPDDVAANPMFLNFLGKTALAELPAIVARARFCVTNDSGPMHLAAAMNVPVLGIFGPTSPLLYGPFPPSRAGNRTICAPHGNLAELPPDAVFAECEKFLAPAAGAKQKTQREVQ